MEGELRAGFCIGAAVEEVEGRRYGGEVEEGERGCMVGGDADGRRRWRRRRSSGGARGCGRCIGGLNEEDDVRETDFFEYTEGDE